MPFLKHLSVLFLLLLCSGCIPTSLHPLYTEEDILFDQRLIGSWSEEDGDDSWTFGVPSGGPARLRSASGWCSSLGNRRTPSSDGWSSGGGDVVAISSLRRRPSNWARSSGRACGSMRRPQFSRPRR